MTVKIFKTIVLGISTAALATLFEQIVAFTAGIFWQHEIVYSFYSRLTWFLILAVLIEEILKYWAVFFVIPRKIELSGKAFVFSSLVLGLSWGIFESGLVLLSQEKYRQDLHAMNPETLLALGWIISIHTITALIMSIFVSTKIFSGWSRHLKNLFFPILLHLLFNFLIIQRGDFTNYLVIISFFIALITGATVFIFNIRKPA